MNIYFYSRLFLQEKYLSFREISYLFASCGKKCALTRLSFLTIPFWRLQQNVIILFTVVPRCTHWTFVLPRRVTMEDISASVNERRWKSTLKGNEKAQFIKNFSSMHFQHVQLRNNDLRSQYMQKIIVIIK